MEEAADVLEAVARQRAIHGSDLLLIFLLKAVRPQKFREHHVVEHAGTVTHDHEQVSDEVRALLSDPEARAVLRRASDRARGRVSLQLPLPLPRAPRDDGGGS